MVTTCARQIFFCCIQFFAKNDLPLHDKHDLVKKKSDAIGPSKNMGIKPPLLSLQPKSNSDLITDFARCEFIFFWIIHKSSKFACSILSNIWIISGEIRQRLNLFQMFLEIIIHICLPSPFYVQNSSLWRTFSSKYVLKNSLRILLEPTYYLGCS